MPTTTIRIEDALKDRIAAAAEREGKTAHAFMLEAIEQTVDQAEQEAAFDRLADERWNDIMADGQTVSWDDMKSWLQARARGERPAAPIPRKPRP